MPLKVVEAVVEAQDETVRAIKEDVKAARGSGDRADAGELSEQEKQKVLALGAAAVGSLVAQRAQLTKEHQATMQTCFEAAAAARSAWERQDWMLAVAAASVLVAAGAIVAARATPRR